MHSFHVTYEFPDITACGGGGRVVERLLQTLPTHDIATDLYTDWSDGHFATFPARHARALRRKLRTQEPDIVHGHFSIPSSVLLPRYAAAIDAPLVITVMGTDIYNPTRFRQLRPLLDRVNGHVLDGADVVVAPSQDLYRRVQSLTETPVEHIAHGIDTDAFASAGNDALHHPVRILTLSRLAPGKQIDTAIEAVTDLREDIDVVHRVVGDGDRREALERKHDHDWLTFTGWADDTLPHYEWADIFLLPSAWEAFGLVFVEALSAGVPVVTTPTGGQRDIVTSNVGALAEADPSELATAMLFVLDEYDERQAQARERAQKFDATAMAKNYAEVYQGLC